MNSADLHTNTRIKYILSVCMHVGVCVFIILPISFFGDLFVQRKNHQKLYAKIMSMQAYRAMEKSNMVSQKATNTSIAPKSIPNDIKLPEINTPKAQKKKPKQSAEQTALSSRNTNAVQLSISQIASQAPVKEEVIEEKKDAKPNKEDNKIVSIQPDVAQSSSNLTETNDNTGNTSSDLTNASNDSDSTSSNRTNANDAFGDGKHNGYIAPRTDAEIAIIQLQRCWSEFYNQEYANNNIYVNAKIQYYDNGYVKHIKIIPVIFTKPKLRQMYKKAAINAQRAISQCSPLDNLDPKNYKEWKSVSINFRYNK